MSTRPSTNYPRCQKHGLPVNQGIISQEDMAKLRRSQTLQWAERFNELFGCQTCPAGGFYAWDVEAVLERMETGRKTGTQLIWD